MLHPVPLVEVRLEVAGPTTAVHLSGELDVSSAGCLASVLSEVIDQAVGPPQVVVDLAGLGFLDARGLSVLASASRLAVGRGGRLALVRPPPIVRRILGITGLDDLLAPGEV